MKKNKNYGLKHASKYVLYALVSVCICGEMVRFAAADEWHVNFSVQNSEPKYLIQEGGVLSGLCGEIYQAMKRELLKVGISVRFDDQPRPIKRILNDLEMGRSDVFCGAGRNEQREAAYIYSVRPVYYTSNVLVSHKDNSFFPKNFMDLKESGLLVGAFSGTTSAEFLKLQTGIRVDDAYTNLNEALKRVSDPSRSRLFYYHDLGMVYLIKKLDLPLRIIPTKFRTVPQWLLYSRSTHKSLVAKIEDAILKIEISGELAEIQSRYVTADKP
ncbi:substrate-binding periplasmic protein [Curvivirga sp.]|uniref:substrate-binding periplasmic protein n=1 Tax=Curvivirga sp. TaxID=2856848 RepID=UPI003B5BA601